MKSYLIYDIGSTYSKVTAYLKDENLKDENLKFLGQASAPTSLEDIQLGLKKAVNNLPEKALKSITTKSKIIASSSAAGGLRMVAMGYMPRVTAKAAKEVAMNAGARVLEVLSHEEEPEFRLEVLKEIKPDIILLAGGTDGGDTSSLIENAKIIIKAQSKAIIIIAGNATAQKQVAQMLSTAQIKHTRVANVMPTIHQLNVKPARVAIHQEFIHQITKAKGLTQFIENNIENKQIIPTPAAILMGAELLSLGTWQTKGVGGVLILDIGGATTDVHSVIPELDKLKNEEKGLIVNNEKQVSFRTVEGNLGLRVSARGIPETVGAGGVLQKKPFNNKYDEQEEEKLLKYVENLELNPQKIPQSEWEKEIEVALAHCSLEVALKRHAGYFVEEYNPVLGLAPGMAVGRDLRGIKWVIGVGGFFSHTSSELALKTLKNIFANPGLSLLPTEAQFRIDSNYLLYSIGLLSQYEADKALNFTKKYFEME